jgi:hypothetical protein
MTVLDLLLGRPLASDEARAECVGAAAGIPIFGLDALSSAACGPEATLTLLITLGAAGIAYIVPIRTSIIVLLAREAEQAKFAGHASGDLDPEEEARANRTMKLFRNHDE